MLIIASFITVVDHCVVAGVLNFLHIAFLMVINTLMQYLYALSFVPGIFVVADTSGVLGFDGPEAAKYMQQTTPACPIMTRDWALCRWLTIEKGVCAIPPSAFYKASHLQMLGMRL